MPQNEDNEPGIKDVMAMLQQMNQNLQKLDTKMEKILEEVEDLKRENKQLKEHIATQDHRISLLERKARKKNLIIKGIIDEKEETMEETIEKTKNLLLIMKITIDINEDIDDVRRIGTFRDDANRPILVKLTREKKKMEILGQTKMLKGTKIWVDEDFTKVVQNERRMLIPHLIRARQQGFKAVLKYNKIIINDEIYSSQDLENVKTGKGGYKDNKRTMNERSPETASYSEQLIKITKTSKN